MKRATHILTMCALFVVFAARLAHADAFIVTGGTYNAGNGVFILDGSGFSLTAADDFPFMPCKPCTAVSSEPLLFSTNLSEQPFSTGFPGTFNGVPLPHTFLNGSLTFTAPTLNSNM